MKERPILFNSEMVRAIMDGRKTMTRRIIKAPLHRDTEGFQCFEGMRWDMLRYDGLRLQTFSCPYGKPGDRLWVRETWAAHWMYDDVRPSECRSDHPGDTYWFKADCPMEGNTGKWRPSIFMPRWASRTTLEVTEVRVERLQDISESDAEAEGAEKALCTGYPYPATLSTYTNGFCQLWESINGSCSWDTNPWVWCVSFKPITTPPPCGDN